MNEIITDKEVFEHCLKNFLEWLDILTMESGELCESWGNYNVAWELVDDLKNDGQSIIDMSCSYLTEVEKYKVNEFLVSLESIPESLLVSETTKEGNREIMSLPFWKKHKRDAATLIQSLELAAINNRKYF